MYEKLSVTNNASDASILQVKVLADEILAPYTAKDPDVLFKVVLLKETLLIYMKVQEVPMVGV